MLVEKDFVMRLVKQLAELFARALKLKGLGKKDEALEVLENGCLSLLGIDFGTLTLMDSASAADLLRDAAKVKTFARLLEETVSLLDEPKASSRRQHALEMYFEALRRKPDDAEAREGVERLKALVPAERLPARYQV